MMLKTLHIVTQRLLSLTHVCFTRSVWCGWCVTILALLIPGNTHVIYSTLYLCLYRSCTINNSTPYKGETSNQNQPVRPPNESVENATMNRFKYYWNECYCPWKRCRICLGRIFGEFLQDVCRAFSEISWMVYNLFFVWWLVTGTSTVTHVFVQACSRKQHKHKWDKKYWLKLFFSYRVDSHWQQSWQR